MYLLPCIANSAKQEAKNKRNVVVASLAGNPLVDHLVLGGTLAE